MTGNIVKKQKNRVFTHQIWNLKKKNQSHVFCQQRTELGSLIGHFGKVSCYNKYNVSRR